MTTTQPDRPELPALPTEVVPGVRYPAKITPLKTGGRRDIEVSDPHPVEAFAGTDIITRLRQFFDALEAEAAQHDADPVALTNAFARMEALTADVRYVRDTIRTCLANRLDVERIRRLTVSGVATVEGVGFIDRSEWRHAELMTAMLKRTFPNGLIDKATGETWDASEFTPLLLDWATPSWKLTPIRAVGLDPDDYCTVITDDDGRAVRTPAVKTVDNSVRRIGGIK